MKTIALVASYGGHLSELKRMIEPNLYKQNNIKTLLITTKPTKDSLFTIKDFNRYNFFLGLSQFNAIRRIIKQNNIHLVVTTGAAPGLYFGLIARLLGKKTIWIDSLANVDKLSMSGKLATIFFHRVFVQWEHLAEGKIEYIGCVL